jgi:hypothetical protein
MIKKNPLVIKNKKNVAHISQKKHYVQEHLRKPGAGGSHL